MLVIDEIGVVAVDSFPNQVGEPADCEDIGAPVELKPVIER